MSKYEQHTINDIINGYIKRIQNNWIPNEVIQLIYKFYDKLLSFDMTNNDKQKPTFNQCKKLYINASSYFAINNDNSLYVFGDNQYSELGIGDDWNDSDDPLKTVFKHNFFNDKNIQVISQGIGNCHSFVYASNVLYGFGSNEDEQLGINTPNDIVNTPIIIEYNFKSKLKDIKCGDLHSLFLTIKGNVYGCGTNDYGQLTSKYASVNRNIIQNILNTNNIKNIYCGINASYILNNDNILMSFGDNRSGQLGIKNDKELQSGNINIVLNGEKIYDFSCGGYYMGCLTFNKKLYMFGNNELAQCGCDMTDITKSSETIAVHDGNNIILPNNARMEQIMCGYDHNIIKSENNVFYTFGCNDSNQLLIQSNNFAEYNPMLILNEYIYNITKSNKLILDLIPSYKETLIIQIHSIK